jgi:murein DD-endopeptidase MepM/ murein hydrolase activator NlpD
MHLRAGSVLTPPGTRVGAGTPVAQVGATGTTGGPHLHLEIWADGWHASVASRPVDPLPDLLAWAAAG